MKRESGSDQVSSSGQCFFLFLRIQALKKLGKNSQTRIPALRLSQLTDCHVSCTRSRLRIFGSLAQISKLSSNLFLKFPNSLRISLMGQALATIQGKFKGIILHLKPLILVRILSSCLKPSYLYTFFQANDALLQVFLGF